LRQVAQEGVKGLCETLAIAFNQRSKPAAAVKTKYDFLVSDAVISAQEIELATRTARRKNLHRGSSGQRIPGQARGPGCALGKFFNVPYESFKSDRVKPADLLKNLKRDFLEQGKWAPVEESSEGIMVVCLDPEQVKGSRIVNNIFPRGKIQYRVTTNHEFAQTLDQLFGATGVPGFSDDSSVGDLLSTLDEGEMDGEGGAATTFPPRPTTSWSSWSTRSSSTPTRWALPTSTSSRVWARTRC
jgi:hypothetical protein